MNRDLREGLRARSSEGELPCLTAFDLVRAQGVPAIEVGRSANEAGIRITRCQLNLFGYHAFGEKRLPIALHVVPEADAEAVRRAADDGQLTCAAAWSLAEGLGLPRPVIGQMAEDLGIRIVDCQLGCF